MVSAIKFIYKNPRAVNLAETSTVNYANLFGQVSDIGPSWSSCFIDSPSYFALQF